VYPRTSPLGEGEWKEGGKRGRIEAGERREESGGGGKGGEKKGNSRSIHPPPTTPVCAPEAGNKKNISKLHFC